MLAQRPLEADLARLVRIVRREVAAEPPIGRAGDDAVDGCGREIPQTRSHVADQDADGHASPWRAAHIGSDSRIGGLLRRHDLAFDRVGVGAIEQVRLVLDPIL